MKQLPVIREGDRFIRTYRCGFFNLFKRSYVLEVQQDSSGCLAFRDMESGCWAGCADATLGDIKFWNQLEYET